jgi:hypothetical protein
MILAWHWTAQYVVDVIEDSRASSSPRLVAHEVWRAGPSVSEATAVII